MQKLEASSPQAQSADLVAANIEQLKAMFPELITEGPNGVAVNVDVLKTLVGDQTVSDAAQKAHKIRNLLQAMRRDDLIHRTGPKATAIWRLGAGQPTGQS